MTRAEWESAFLDEMRKLRPHMFDAVTGMANRAAYTLATVLFNPGEDPKTTAQRWHAQAPKVKKR